MVNSIRLNTLIKIIRFIALLGIVIIIWRFFLQDMQMQKKKVAYESLIEKDFNKTFSYLALWDEYVDVQSKYSTDKAKDIYLEKMDRLTKEKGYKIISAYTKIINRDRMFFVEADVTAEIDGQITRYKDLLQFRIKKLYIDYSEDIYSHYGTAS